MLAVLLLTLVFFALGVGLSLAGRSLQGESESVVESVHALLPKTQCAQCGFPGCRPYAEAIAADEVNINKCPPGGQALVDRLAELLQRPTLGLDTETGKPSVEETAVIVESDCIGCTLCIQACPVDAIVGAAKQMHTVIRSECTGCELCIPPCPVDCITMVPVYRLPS